ncbi:MAG: oligoendopeptidase F [Bacillota bacterium]|nr:oligoendopeptidase F [Bacillota bacterium]
MSKKVLERSEIPEKDKWDLSKIYVDDEAWNRDLEDVQSLLSQYSQYPGRVAESGEVLYQYLQLDEKVSRKLDTLYVYAKMKQDEDNRKNIYQAMADKAMMVTVKASEASSFFTPEIMAAGEERIKALMAEYPKLGEYDILFEHLLRFQAHTLSAAEEKLLAMSGDMAESPQATFTMFNEADITFPEVTLGSGEAVAITHGNYIKLMEDSDRKVREAAFKGLYSSYRAFRNTVGATLSGSVKKDVFYAKARNYPSALEAALYQDNIPVSLYDNLIVTVKDNLVSFQEYLKLRKKVLNLDELHFYDLYTPLAKESQKEIPFEEGFNTVKAALAPLGAEYAEVLERARAERWIDVRENVGKRSGAYSWGVYDTVPYLFLSYQDNLNSVFTLGHELGHSMHSYYSRNNQPYQYAYYKIFVAEVASTVNETLLTHYLLENSQDEGERIFILNQYLEEFRGTVYRQTMFGEFERIIHAKTEAMESLTADDFCQIYLDLNKEYFGDVMVYDEEIALEWARIPHFYNAFYVYKYATSFAAAQYLAKGILSGDEDCVKRYLQFLKSGCSDHPNELLKKAGVDLTEPKTIAGIFPLFKTYLEELAQLLS